jgi:hypothetical protein
MSGIMIYGADASQGITNPAAVVVFSPASVAVPEVTRTLAILLDAGSTSSYPGTGAYWLDISPVAARHATGTNASWNPAGYFDFNGSSSKFGWPAQGLSNGTNCSLSVWFRCRDVSKYQDLFDQRDTYGVWTSIATFGQVGALRASWNTLTNPLLSSQNIVNDQWYNLLFVGQAASSSLYLNNVNVANNTSQPLPEQNLIDARIGNVDGDRGAEYFTGSIAVFAWWSGTLTRDEITQHFEHYRNRFGL